MRARSLSFCLWEETKLNFELQLLEPLTLLFFAPDTSSNVVLRQCLLTFFQAYCYSSHINQGKFAEVCSLLHFQNGTNP